MSADPTSSVAPTLPAAPGRRRHDPTRPRYTAVASLATLALAVLVPLLATYDVRLPGRAALSLLYFFCVPGVPVALALRLPRLLTMALAVAVSFTWAIVQGTVAIKIGWWHPVEGAWIGTAVTAVAVAVALRSVTSEPGDEFDAASMREQRRSGRPSLLGGGTIAGLLVLAVAAACWWWETRVIDLDAVGHLGLLPAVGWRTYVALLLVAVVVARALLRRVCDHVLLTVSALLVSVIGYCTVAVADGETSVPVSWVHVAFVQYISENGAVPASVDARFSWPGFFAAAAQLVALAGTRDSSSFLVFASAVYTALAIPALLVISRVVTRSWRWAWVAVFVYLFTNWYQQDYFAPQATAFVTYLAILATLLWMSGAVRPAVAGAGWRTWLTSIVFRVPQLPQGVSIAQARVIGLVLCFLVTGTVLGHQLTPVTLIMVLAVFVVTGRTRYRLLWLVAGLVLAAYFSYGATDYWIGHLGTVLGDVGQVGNSLDAGVAQRLTGDSTYQSAQYVRIATSGGVFVLACAGLLRLLLQRRGQVVLFAGLAAAPFGLVLVQSYGGEVFIRCFLFASPMLAPLAAVALGWLWAFLAGAGGGRVLLRRPRPGGASMLVWTTGVSLVLVLAGSVLLFTRGLNASFERTSPGQAAASLEYYRLAAPYDAVGVPSGTTGVAPYHDILSHPTVYLDVDTCLNEGVSECTDDDPPRFVLVTQTQERAGELLQGRATGWVWSFADSLVASGNYAVVYRTGGALLLEHTLTGVES